MKFNIKRLEIKNFRSIQDTVVFDVKEGLFSIEGINLDEPSSTNGCGKSSIVSALFWCLTGNALTNEILADEVINIKAGKNCKVSVVIETQDGEICVTRMRKDSEFGNTLFLEINGQDLTCHKVADTQARLNQLIKIPFDLLRSTIIMTSDMQSAFSELSPQQRIQVLESIRDYSLWNKVRDEANNDIKSYNASIQAKKLKVSSLEGSKATYLKLDTENENLLNGLLNNFDLDKNKASIIEFEKQKETNQLNIIKLENDKSALLEKVNNFISNDVYLKQMDEISNYANALLNDKQAIVLNKSKLSTEIELIERWFKEDVCPTCKRKLDRTDEEITNKNNLLNKLKQDVLKLNNDIENLDITIQNKRIEWSNVHKLVLENENKNKAYQNDLQNIDSKINDLKLKNANLDREISKINTAISTFDIQITEAKNKHNEYIAEISKIETEIKENLDSIDILCAKRQLSDYFYKLLGSKGELRPYLLNKDIQYLNSCMQRYICKFFKNTDVTLCLNGATIDILIDSNGIHKSVSSLSGGEKKRLNLAIQLALYDLIKSTANIEFNLLWLDEVESQLDPLGCQQLIEIIEDKSEEIESVYWITNNAMVKENIVNKIICKKAMGKTEVEFKCEY